MRFENLRDGARTVAYRGASAAVVLGMTAAPARADLLDGLARTIDAAGRTWGPALLVLSALVAGGAIALGSHGSGEKVKNFLIGAVFLALAAAGGSALLAKITGLGI